MNDPATMLPKWNLKALKTGEMQVLQACLPKYQETALPEIQKLTRISELFTELLEEYQPPIELDKDQRRQEHIADSTGRVEWLFRRELRCRDAPESQQLESGQYHQSEGQKEEHWDVDEHGRVAGDQAG